MNTSILSASGLAVLEFESSVQPPVPNRAWTESFGQIPSIWQNLFLEEDRATVSGLVARATGTAEARLGCSRESSRVALQCDRIDDKIRLFAIPIPPGPSDEMGETLARERALGEMRMRFLSLVSHEFRTPLTVILSSAELLEHYGTNWPESKRQSHFLRMQGAVATMTTLLDNVSFLGRAESGRLENAPDALALAQLVSSVVEDLAPLRGIGQEIRFAVSPPDASVNVDHRIARAVLANLLSNALRFSPSICLVVVSATVRNGSLEISVSDQGSGIPVRDTDRIWEPFERGSNAVGIPGSGLGLAIVRRCMELVGGTASLQSDPEGVGTRAVATFPIGAAS